MALEHRDPPAEQPAEGDGNGNGLRGRFDPNPPSPGQSQAADQAANVQSGSDLTAMSTPPLCPEHGRYAPCPKHDCPHCYVGEFGRGECARCDGLTHPTPVVDCPAGEDCPHCRECGVAANGDATCACKATLCSECDRCPRHAADDCAGCADLFGGAGRAYCGGHGWVDLCAKHTGCPGGEDCELRPFEAGDPDCAHCRGAGCDGWDPCEHCHPHCPGCWAEGVLRSKREPNLGPPPPPCPECQAALTPQTLAAVVEWVDGRNRNAMVTP